MFADRWYIYIYHISNTYTHIRYSQTTKPHYNSLYTIQIRSSKKIDEFNFKRICLPTVDIYIYIYIYIYIISQIPPPIYDIAKQLNHIITPYIPSKYIINSTDDFLQILRVLLPNGIIASLDVESLMAWPWDHPLVSLSPIFICAI